MRREGRDRWGRVTCRFEGQTFPQLSYFTAWRRSRPAITQVGPAVSNGPRGSFDATDSGDCVYRGSANSLGSSTCKEHRTNHPFTLSPSSSFFVTSSSLTHVVPPLTTRQLQMPAPKAHTPRRCPPKGDPQPYICSSPPKKVYLLYFPPFAFSSTHTQHIFERRFQLYVGSRQDGVGCRSHRQGLGVHLRSSGRRFGGGAGAEENGRMGGADPDLVYALVHGMSPVDIG
jgi:hypothetical protein